MVNADVVKLLLCGLSINPTQQIDHRIEDRDQGVELILGEENAYRCTGSSCLIFLLGNLYSRA
jgi:hypothetical protein